MSRKTHSTPPSYSLPQYPRYRVQVAIYAGILACICAVPQFLPTLQEALLQHLYVIGILYGFISASLDSATFMNLPWRLLVGVCAGAGSGYVVVLLVTAMGGGVYNPFYGTLLMFPFLFTFSLAQPTSKCKLTQLYSYIACNLVMVSVVVFSGPFPRKCFFSALFAGVLAFVVPVTLTGTFNILGLLPRTAPEPMPVFEYAVGNYFKSNACYILDGDLHKQELDELRRALVNARKAVLASVTDTDLRLCIFRLTSTLYGLRRASRWEPFSEAAVTHLWEPMQMELRNLMTYVTALLKHEVELDDIPDLKSTARNALIRIKRISIEYSRAVADQKSVVISTREMARVEFAMLAIPRFAILVNRYFELKAKRSPPKPSLMRYIPLFPPLRHPIKFLKQPTWPPGTSLRDKIVFPLRLSICATIMLEATLAVGQVYPILLTEGLWICLPCLTCFLPTVGYTIGKGLRRMLGVMIGGAAAILIVYVNPMDIPAVMVELFIAGALGKFFTMDPAIGYLGFQTTVTFCVVGVCSALDPTLNGEDRLHAALLRMLFTLIGLVISISLSLVTFPSYCGRRLALQTGKELSCASSVVSALVKRLVARKHDGSKEPEEQPLPSMFEVGASLLKEDNSRLGEQRWFREEATYLKLVNFTSTRCAVKPKCLGCAQDEITRLSRSAIVVTQILWGCDQRMSEATDHFLLEPIRPLLGDLAEHLERSAVELDRCLHGVVETEPAIEATGETLEAMLYLNAKFDESRTKMLFTRTWAAKGQKMDSTHMIEVLSSGGGVGVHEAIHAINVFIEDWVTVVNQLLGCQLSVPHAPVEESVISFGSFDTTTGSYYEGVRRRAETCAY
ncbi:hypothetical protein FOZ63_033539 [Perkinsus olseni]|uniref:Aluminum-activated malate transporter 1 n=1 Tax=Perkinsus olseni TaxID=32597 RepID=A0A7J6TDL4_PEROL|nr:hypothetical protein FOZ62_011124 [Perkinsus olseni]KAF4742917.1 hypothetical protein FOZ63_033539 [Perkinsus olseni]